LADVAAREKRPSLWGPGRLDWSRPLTHEAFLVGGTIDLFPAIEVPRAGTRRPIDGRPGQDAPARRENRAREQNALYIRAVVTA
jgi:hypothetical protein